MNLSLKEVNEQSGRKTSTPPSAASRCGASLLEESIRKDGRASPPRTAWAPVFRLPVGRRAGPRGRDRHRRRGQRPDRRHQSEVHRRAGDRRHPPLQRVPGLPRRLLHRRGAGRPPRSAGRLRWKSEDAARKEVKVYGDYKELIAHAKDDKLEAVIIALPLHLHAPVAIAAMQAGLHVITEKLMGHSVCQCKEMALTAKQTDRLLATGHQRHYSILYDNAVELLRQGLLGELHYIRAQWHRGNLPGHDSWQPPLPESVKRATTGWPSIWRSSWIPPKSSWPRPAARPSTCVEKRVDQAKAQIADKIVEAEKFGYQTQTDRRRRRPGRLRGAGHRGIDPLAALGPHRRRHDGRVGQPPTRRGQHLHRRGARRREAASLDAWPPPATAPSSPPTATSRITSAASSSSPPRVTTPTTPSPPRRRSASSTPRSTATATAATAKPCWGPKAPWSSSASRT